jgi:hypothetical protein
MSISSNLSALASLLTAASTEKALLRQALIDKGVDMSGVPFSLYHTKLAMLSLPAQSFSFLWSAESATLNLAQYTLMSAVSVIAVGGGNASANGGAGGMVSASISQANATGKSLTITAGAAGANSTLSWSGGSVAANVGSAPTGGSGSASGVASSSVTQGANGTNASTGTNRVGYAISWNAGVITNNSPFAVTLTHAGIATSTGCTVGSGSLTIAAKSSDSSLAPTVAAGAIAIVGIFTVTGTADGTVTTSQVSINSSGSFTVYNNESYTIPATAGAATYTRNSVQYGKGGTSGTARNGCVLVEFTGVLNT